MPVISHATDTSNIDYYDEDDAESYELLDHDPLIFDGFPSATDEGPDQEGGGLEVWTGGEHADSAMINDDRATSIEFDPGPPIVLPTSH